MSSLYACEVERIRGPRLTLRVKIDHPDERAFGTSLAFVRDLMSRFLSRLGAAPEDLVAVELTGPVGCKVVDRGTGWMRVARVRGHRPTLRYHVLFSDEARLAGVTQGERFDSAAFVQDFPP